MKRGARGSCVDAVLFAAECEADDLMRLSGQLRLRLRIDSSHGISLSF
jgi:hypothetical protein